MLEYVFLEGEAQTARTYPVASEALTRMVEDARAEGIELYVGSAYRKYRTQEVMPYNRVQKIGQDDGAVQMAGASEHQSGLADVVSWAYKDRFLPSFGDTREGEWLAANCARYGFIIRYLKDSVHQSA